MTFVMYPGRGGECALNQAFCVLCVLIVHNIIATKGPSINYVARSNRGRGFFSKMLLYGVTVYMVLHTYITFGGMK